MILLLFPVLVAPALLGAFRQTLRDQPKPRPAIKPVYVMQSSKPRPSHNGNPAKRDSEFYRNRRTKKAIRKLPF